MISTELKLLYGVHGGGVPKLRFHPRGTDSGNHHGFSETARGQVVGRRLQTLGLAFGSLGAGIASTDRKGSHTPASQTNVEPAEVRLKCSIPEGTRNAELKKEALDLAHERNQLR